MKKIIYFAMMMILVAGVTACGQKEKTAETKKDTETKETPVQSEEPDSESETAADTIAELEPENVKVNIYCSNEQADAFVTEEVHLTGVDADVLLEQLKTYSGIPKGVKVNHFEAYQENDEKLLILNLSEEFEAHLNNMGSAGEYMIMGSVVNTFLEAYEADKILITSDNDLLESGHGDYGSYLSFYE